MLNLIYLIEMFTFVYTSYTMSYNQDITLTSFCEPTTANAYMVYILKHNLNNVLLALH